MNENLNVTDEATSGLPLLTEPIPDRLKALRAYWRLDDFICREFLTLGTTPANFEAVKLLFPYLRETAVCETPREWAFIADLQFFAFYAGHDLG
jgi:hypothetical protein